MNKKTFVASVLTALLAAFAPQSRAHTGGIPGSPEAIAFGQLYTYEGKKLVPIEGVRIIRSVAVAHLNEHIQPKKLEVSLLGSWLNSVRKNYPNLLPKSAQLEFDGVKGYCVWPIQQMTEELAKPKRVSLDPMIPAPSHYMPRIPRSFDTSGLRAGTFINASIRGLLGAKKVFVWLNPAVLLRLP